MTQRKVTVTFTRAQAEAVDAALAYFTAGSPEDVGQYGAEGGRVLRAASRAHDALAAAIDGRGD